MAQSLSQIYIHIIYGTKNRYPYITSEIENRLHAYIAGILKNNECNAILINSMPDHIHILTTFSKNHAPAKIVEIIKKESSKWMKSEGIVGFTWQIGYGVFSVSSSKVEVVKNYILKQKEHHKIKTFKEEVEEFFKEYSVNEYNEKYFWQ